MNTERLVDAEGECMFATVTDNKPSSTRLHNTYAKAWQDATNRGLSVQCIYIRFANIKMTADTTVLHGQK